MTILSSTHSRIKFSPLDAHRLTRLVVRTVITITRLLATLTAVSLNMVANAPAATATATPALTLQSTPAFPAMRQPTRSFMQTLSARRCVGMGSTTEPSSATMATS